MRASDRVSGPPVDGAAAGAPVTDSTAETQLDPRSGGPATPGLPEGSPGAPLPAAYPVAARRRASRSLWQACETLISASADPRALGRALEAMRHAFDCDGVALHVLGPSGQIEPWCARGRWHVPAGDLRDCMSMPLLHGRQRLGSLDLMARPGQHWQPAQLGLIRTASGALGAALGARLELERLRNQPGRDPVTGLPDEHAFRARMLEELERARRHGPPLALTLIELDHFDALHQRYGREVAAGVLSEATVVLKLALRESDVLAHPDPAPASRHGRFVVLLPETQAVAAVRCADRLKRVLEEHRFAHVGRVSATAGVAASPRDGLEAVELIEAARQALALAHKSGRRHVGAPVRPSVQ